MIVLERLPGSLRISLSEASTSGWWIALMSRSKWRRKATGDSAHRHPPFIAETTAGGVDGGTTWAGSS